ncbi:hypothetical protein KKA93_04000 [Patescibacteria group bacterium]|nr:hypothetical protein [Patescibacteria group bacterium]MBU1663337.1 hypothetical protein [Patescibacteria group bacterium]MBU1933678.1 hypothetical protein [Patescibacteria group bacterium]MBU2008111.1 hypothetical protein [Patescibacteria group bacterium]MBU2233456.1 hypothetical protein [Patescibacteria group bacterium]
MKKILCFTISIVLLSSIFFNVNIEKVLATSFWEGLKTTGGKIGYSSDETSLSLPGKIGKILSISTIFLAVVFLGLMIYAGFLWMLARGNEQEVEKAKNIIIYAVIGLVVVLAAYAITRVMAILWEEVKI